MTSISYSELFSRFYSKVEAYDLFDTNTTDEMRVSFLCSYVHTALSKPLVRGLFSSITIVDGDGENLSITDEDIITVDEANDIFDNANQHLLDDEDYDETSDDLEYEEGDIEYGVITFELNHPIDDSTDKDFVIEMVAMGMMLAWVEPKVKSLTTLRRLVGTSDEKWYSESTFLTSLQSLQESISTDLSFLIQNRGFISNDYLDGNAASASLRGSL